MKRKIQPIFPLLFLLFSFQFASAQEDIAFSFTTHTVEPAETVEVEVSVTGFTDIISVQFTMEYDPTVLDFVNVDNFGLEYMANSNFGTPPDIDDGFVTFAWLDESLQGLDADDETVIFSIIFQTVGMAGDSSALTFGNSPTMIEVGATGGQVMEPTFNAGYVKIAGNTSVRRIETDAFVFHPVAPNPVNELAMIRFELFEGTETYFSIYDLTGKVIYENREYRSSGHHTLEIPSYVFPVQGAYFCRLDAGGHKGIQKILLIR